MVGCHGWLGCRSSRPPVAAHRPPVSKSARMKTTYPIPYVRGPIRPVIHVMHEKLSRKKNTFAKSIAELSRGIMDGTKWSSPSYCKARTFRSTLICTICNGLPNKWTSCKKGLRSCSICSSPLKKKSNSDRFPPKPTGEITPKQMEVMRNTSTGHCACGRHKEAGVRATEAHLWFPLRMVRFRTG